MKKLFLFFSLLLLQLIATAGPFKTIITDGVTHEPLPGALIVLKSNYKTISSVISGLDGSVNYRSIAPGEYQVEISYTGYTTLRKSIIVGKQDFNFELTPVQRVLEAVTVQAITNKGSDKAVQTVERRADNILNAVSAKTIEVSPDLSVANVIQRVSGVSLQRSNNGEGQYAIVRGMDKRYNYTLVNGIKIPSPDNKNRYVPLDIFPAELLDRLEVSKALTPNMEGDAIGGVVNMVMKEAPYKFTVNATIAASYAQAFVDGKDFTSFDHSASNKKSPRDRNGDNYLATINDFPNSPFKYSTKTPVGINGGLSLGGRLFKNKLGVMFAASSQTNYRDVQTLFFKTETNRIDNSPSFTDIQRRNYSVEQNRNGLHSYWDFSFNTKNKLTFYTAYLNLTQNEYRFVSDTNLVLGRVGEGTGRINNSIRTTRNVQEIYNATLKGDHKLMPNFSVNWAAAYSKATARQPDRASLELTTGVTKDANGKLQSQPVYLDNSTYRDWARNSDEDKSGYLNFLLTTKIFNTKVDWTAGGMYRDKHRSSFYDNYNLRPASSPQAYTGNIDQNTFVVFNPQGSSTSALNYTSNEKVAAGYAMLKTQIGALQIVTGVRYEHTDFDWATAAPETVEGTFGKINYYDVLPSVHLKYRVANNQFLRASYFSSISRPGFYEITPHTYDDGSSDYLEKGNPYLKRTTAENFDLRYEYFPKGLDQLLAGVFYKSIDNPIEYAIDEAGAGRTYYIPKNFGQGNNYGFEVDVTKYFNAFGIKANYTFTNSEITTSKTRRFQKTEANGSTTLTQEQVDQTRPLQGQSKHIGNLSALYKNAKRGLDAQLAMVYTGERINVVSPFLDNDIWQKGFVQLDFSGEVRVVRRLSVFTKINNILNTPSELEIHQKNTASVTGIPKQEVGENGFVRKDSYGANYLLGVRFKL